MMIESPSQGLLLFMSCLIVGVMGQQNGGPLECHPSPWINGQLFTITLRIDRTKFPSLCTRRTDGQPIFEGSLDGSTYQSNCTVSDIRPPGACSYTPGTEGCGCTNSDDNGFYVIEYNIIAGPHHYRWWRASLACTGNSFNQAIDFPDICNQTEITLTEVSTTTQPTRNETDCRYCDFECGETSDHKGCIVMITFIIIGVGVITAVIVAVVKQCT